MTDDAALAAFEACRVAVRGADGVSAVAAIEAEGDRIRALYVVVNPDKLRRW